MILQKFVAGIDSNTKATIYLVAVVTFMIGAFYFTRGEPRLRSLIEGLAGALLIIVIGVIAMLLRKDEHEASGISD